MRLLRRRGEPVEERSNFVWPFPGMFGGASTWAGVPVDAQSALRSMAVTACVRLLKTSISNLPVDAIRYRGSGGRENVSPQPGIVARPSGRVSRRVWVAQMMHSLLTDGNAYGMVVATDTMGRPTQVEPVSPGDVTWVQDRPFVKAKEVAVWPAGDLIHIPASAFAVAGSPTALSPVDLAKQPISAGLAAEQFGARFFGEGATPSSVIKSKTPLTKEQADAIKDVARRMVGSREPAVFGADLEWEQISVKPNESQFIDLIRFEVEQVCRCYGVPPSMAFAAVSGQNVTYTNATQQDLAYLKFSLQSWLLDLEDAWSSWCTAPVVVKLNVDSLLRMDTMTRYQKHEIALRNKLTTVNEIRMLEDELPFGAEFDVPGIPGDPGPTPPGVTA